MSSPNGPRLVHDADRRAAAEPAASRSAGTPGGVRVLRWIVVAALLAVAGYGVVESRRAAALDAEVTRLTGELAAAEATVEAHREHLGAIRSGVDGVRDGLAGVRDSLAALEALAASDPAPPPPDAE